MASELTINAGQYSEKGVKDSNEDACGIYVPPQPLLTTKGIGIIIADGVSGSSMGREAAEACVQGFLGDYYSTSESWTVKTSVSRVLGALNRWLYSQGQNNSHSGQCMLTTLSAIVIKSTTAHIFHVGDTRIYRLRDQDLECLTRDHQTWVSSEKTFLNRAMGADISIDIDYQKHAIEPGDIFILTSDGVHEHVNNKTLITLIRDNHDHLEKTARNIVTTALENGSSDNVTCQIIKIESLGDQNSSSF